MYSFRGTINLFLSVLVYLAFANSAFSQYDHYIGDYELILRQKSYTLFNSEKNQCNSGKYYWSNDTIYFLVIPVYDTIVILDPESGTEESVYRISRGFIGAKWIFTKKEKIIPGLRKLKESLDLHVERLVELPWGKKIIAPDYYGDAIPDVADYWEPEQVLEGYPQFLIKKRGKLGYYGSGNKFIVVLRKEKDRWIFERKMRRKCGGMVIE